MQTISDNKQNRFHGISIVSISRASSRDLEREFTIKLIIPLTVVVSMLLSFVFNCWSDWEYVETPGTKFFCGMLLTRLVFIEGRLNELQNRLDALQTGVFQNGRISAS